MSINRIDPVAQTFIIDEPTYLTKVDLFFSSKDTNIPVFMQVRRNKDNRPTNSILPFSQVTIPAANVFISSNANTATTVTFAAPVFCDTGEYSLTLGSDSRAYNHYVSELNGTDTLTGRTISEQPLIGSLFLSENLNLFQPDLFEDLKVNIYRAKFSTTVTGTVELDLLGRGASEGIADSTLPEDPLEVFPNIKTMKVYTFNHAFLNGSFVRLTNVSNANALGRVGNVVGLHGNLIQDVDFEVSNVRFDSFTVNLAKVPNVKKVTRFGGGIVSLERNIGYSTITPQLSIFSPANSKVISKVITTTPTTGAYTVDSSFSEIQNAVENKFDTIKVIASRKNESHRTANVDSFRYKLEMSTNNDRVSPIIDTQQLGVNFKRNLVNDPTYAELDAHELTVLSRDGTAGKGGHKANIVALTDTTAVITLQNVRSQENANILLNGTILNVQSNAAVAAVGAGTYNNGLYRVIDVIDGGLNIKVALVNIANTIITTDEANNNVYSILSTSDFVAEEAAEGGSAFSKYISRQVDFINPSTGIKFFFDVSKPAAATVDIFLKTKLAGDTTPMNQVEYTKVSNVTITDSLGGEFVQFQQEVTNLEDFNALVFKLVLESTDESQIPRIKNLRAIAIQ